MSWDIPQSRLKRLLSMSSDERRSFITKCRPEELLVWDAMFDIWAQDAQLAPQRESWRVWLMMAGRGFGKTRAGAEWVNRIGSGRAVRIALVAATLDEARSVMVEGASGILSVARRRRQRVRWEPSRRRLTWAQGSVAELFSGDNGDALRGPEHHFAWCDELAKWRDAENAWHNLQMGLRAGPRPRALVTTTPRPLPLLERLREDKRTVTSSGRTSDNISLPDSYVEAMVATYGGSRLGRQELDGELIKDVEGSLWPRELIERCRVNALTLATLRDGPLPLPQGGEGLFDRVVVGVDPPAGAGEGCDACGIVVCGRSGDVLYVLADESVGGLSPEGWANRVAAAAARWNASIVVAEANNGGAMVDSVLRAAQVPVRVKLVHASKGKAARAEPVALRFETGRALFAGEFKALEDELSGLVAGGGYEGPGRSPDRADAMVWAMTELGETRSGLPRVRRL